MPEDAFLDHLRRTAAADPRVVVPIGDDFAAVRWSEDLLLIGADQVLDGVHFDSNVHSPQQVGRKAVNRNLSDCAAMACLPAFAVVTLALPRDAGERYAERLMDGVRSAADAHGCAVVGGDTGSWLGPLAVTVAVLARPAGLRPVTRSGARPGDRLYVTGPLGGSILGRHLTFEPRVALARELATRYELRAMMDLSDGLSRDLPRLCTMSHVGATLDAARVPIHVDATRMADGRPPLDHALHDGEDHELLFACGRCDHPAAIEVGTIDAEPGVRLRADGQVASLAPLGWEHAL